MSAWQPIETAPKKRKIIVSDGQSICAVGYLAKVRWYLGDYPNKWRTALGFSPKWWMPPYVEGNPLRVAFPDGALSIADRLGEAP